jgi:hypothetical protein
VCSAAVVPLNWCDRGVRCDALPAMLGGCPSNAAKRTSYVRKAPRLRSISGSPRSRRINTASCRRRSSSPWGWVCARSPIARPPAACTACTAASMRSATLCWVRAGDGWRPYWLAGQAPRSATPPRPRAARERGGLDRRRCRHRGRTAHAVPAARASQLDDALGRGHHPPRHPRHRPGQNDPRPRRHAPEKTARAPPGPCGEREAHGCRLPRCPRASPPRPPRSDQAAGGPQRPHTRDHDHQERARGAVPRRATQRTSNARA